MPDTKILQTFTMTTHTQSQNHHPGVMGGGEPKPMLDAN